jgi:sulfopyruvate decarboxylase subunit beta
MMIRDKCLEALAGHRNGAIVVAVYNAGFDWLRISPNPLNYYAVGAMGQASSHALAIALAVPERKVIVLDGDGSLLMNLGSLVTIAAAGPRNLLHLVFENGCYEANGSHPIPGQNQVKFAEIARAAGYRHSFEFDDLALFSNAIPELTLLEGPVFTALKVVPGEKSKLDWVFINGEQTRTDFREAVAKIIRARH